MQKVARIRMTLELYEDATTFPKGDADLIVSYDTHGGASYAGMRGDSLYISGRGSGGIQRGELIIIHDVTKAIVEHVNPPSNPCLNHDWRSAQNPSDRPAIGYLHHANLPWYKRCGVGWRGGPARMNAGDR